VLAGSAGGLAPTNCCARGSEQHAAVSTTVEQAGHRIRFCTGPVSSTGVACVPSPDATNRPGSRSSPRPPTPTRSGTPGLCACPSALDCAGPSPTPSARDAGAAGRAADQRRRAPFGASRRTARRADRRRPWAGQVNGTVGRYSAVRRLPARWRPPAVSSPSATAVALVAGRGQPAGGRGPLTLAELDGPRHRPIGWDLCAGAGWQDRAAGRGSRRRMLRSPRSRPTAQARRLRRAEHPRACRLRCWRVGRPRPPGSNRGFDRVARRRLRAPGLARCGAGQNPAGGRQPGDVPQLIKLQARAAGPRRSG